MDEKMLKNKAKEMRISILKCIASIGQGHVGGALSIVEILTYLYFNKMNIDPKDPKKKDRDRLVCSKGHAGPAVYSALCLKGYFPESELLTLNKNGTNLPSHCDQKRTVGVDFTTGSLGQGISGAVGIALGQKLLGQKAKTFCIIGDGESQEGQIWEAAETAPQWKLGNLVVFLDFNKLQLDGPLSDIIDPRDVEGKWKSFGWDVHRIDGHDFTAIDKAVEASLALPDKPSIIICDTIKAKGYKAMEGSPKCHSIPLSQEDLKNAIAQIEKE